MIAAQSPMIVYEDSSGPLSQISSDNVQARRVENEDPLDLRRLSLFFRREPPSLSIEKLVEFISDWDIGELMFMMMEKRASVSLGRNPLYFCFEGKGQTNNSSFKRSNTLKTILFRVSRGGFMTVPISHERSSNHL